MEENITGGIPTPNAEPQGENATPTQPTATTKVVPNAEPQQKQVLPKKHLPKTR